MSEAARPNRQIPVDRAKIILVEGRDEVAFFEALLRDLGISDVRVLDVGGKARFGAMLAAIKVDERFGDVRTILLVRDADWQKPTGTNATAALDALVGALKTAGLAQPAGHAVLAGDARLKTAAYVMPDGVSDGMLEDLCLRAMLEDPVMPCVDGYFDCLKRAGIEHAAKDVAKARAHALLASRKDPDLRVGEAAQRGYWPFAAVAFEPLVTLLRSL